MSLFNNKDTTPPASLVQGVAESLAQIKPSLLMSQPPRLPAVRPPCKRAKLWTLPAKYHCPVIGTCLSIGELVKFARQFAFGVSLRDEFSMHVETVSRVGTRNEVSETLHKHLDRKYQACLSRFEQRKTDAEVLTLWQAHYARGEVAEAMWATLTHKAVSDDTRHRVYADVHMLSHQVGAGQASDTRRLASLERDNAATKAIIERERREHLLTDASLRERVGLLEAERDALYAEAAEARDLRERLNAFESGAIMVDMAHRLMNLTIDNEQLRAVAERIVALEEALKAANDKSMRLARECSELVTARDALERLLLAKDAGEEQCDGHCDSCANEAAGHCVLCVGGRTALLPQYRLLAERLGIRLIHHDGGKEEALSRLPDMINTADAVICPTDCVSHNAYYQLKRHCKRTGKPCVLFKGASISGFAVALTRLSSGRVSLVVKSSNPPSD